MDPSQSAAILANSSVQLAYFAVLIVLVLLIAYYVSGKSERMDNGVGGYATPYAKPYDSGGNVRVLSQTFSGTNQEEYGTPYVAQVKAMAPLLTPEQEMLVNQGGYPDFWSISGELDEYKAQTATAWQADAAAGVSGDASVGSERMSTPASNLIDTQLAGGFYPGASTF